MLLKERIIRTIENALDGIGKIERPDVRIEYAREEGFGDYASPIAMDRRFRDVYSAIDPQFSNPRKFAEAIVARLTGDSTLSSHFSKVEIAGPGFINMTVSDHILFEYVEEALSKTAKYGRSKAANPRKIVFEFVSANPTGPLNIVSARAAALGDSCCNLLEARGDEVFREYYVNDFGNQVDLLGISCLLRFLQLKGIPLRFAHKKEDGVVTYPPGHGLPFPAEGYHGEYLTDVVRKIIRKRKRAVPPAAFILKAKELAKVLPAADFFGTVMQFSSVANVMKDLPLDFDFNLLEFKDFASGMGTAAIDYFLETHGRDLKKFRVQFDNYFRERTLHETDALKKANERISRHVFIQDGKQFFRSTDFGDDKDRVIIRDDGRPTYLLADIAYHQTKIDRKFTDIINIWGPDHHGYIKRLAGAVAAMGFPAERFRVLLAQQVNLLDGGVPTVMSKRTGKIITMDSLIQDIPVDVARYFFAMRSLEAHLDFDLSEARDTTDKNPYYYVAYAHARIRSIFAKAKTRDLKPLKKVKAANLEMTPERRRLLWMIARFPEEIRDAADALEPHRVITFLYQMASALSRFYGPRENKIIDQDSLTAGALLAVLDGVAVCLKNGLKLLGMKAPERMIRETSETPEASETLDA